MSMWMALLKRKLSLFIFGLRNLTATLQAAALQQKKKDNKSCIFQHHHKRPDEKRNGGLQSMLYTEAWKAAVHLVMDFMWE